MKADSEAVGAAARCLAAGGLVAFPTETVYGLGADAQDGIAVARLYDAKGRPAFNPLIAHVPDLAAARRLATFDATAERLATGAVARAPHAGAAEGFGLRGGGTRHRRARQHRGARAGSSGRARHPRGARTPGGRAVGQPLGPRLADHRAACARRPARPHRPDRRRRRHACRRRIHHRRLPRRAGAAAARRRAARRDRARARRRARRSARARRHRRRRGAAARPASSPRITRRAAGCGSMRPACRPARPCSPSARRCPPARSRCARSTCRRAAT